MTFDEYRVKARALTDEHPAPGKTIRDWAKLWGEIFSTLLQGRSDANGGAVGQGIFEPCSLVVARWEFLGTLLTGWTGDSNRRQTLEYAERFLEPVNPRYGASHPTIHQTTKIAELLVCIMRNGSLHSFTPRGVYDPASNSCIGWALGYQLDPAGTPHLGFNANAGLFVDGTLLVRELVDSMGAYADYLDRNAPEPDGRTPADNFRNGFFARLRPRGPSREDPATWTY